MKQLPHAGLALIACALLPLALLGGSTQRDLISEQIDTLAGTTGLSRVSHPLYRDWLTEGAHQLVGFDLEANVRYEMLGTCDADCSDLRFELLRPDGTRLAQVTDGEQRPVLTVRPDRPGRYQLRTTMSGCSISPCEWGIRVYRR
jgi:hypothetical protein